MPKYLIEVPHEKAANACDLAVDILKSTGSHFLTNAVFGCPDGVHKSWMIISTNDRAGALRIIPPPLRKKAKVIRVRKFSLEKVDKLLRPYHK